MNSSAAVNPIFQVLVVGNTGLLEAGYAPTELSVGQLGVFNYETNLSIDPTATLPDKFYLMVGVPNAAGTLGDLRKSAGEAIWKHLVNSVYSKNYDAGSDQVIDIDFTAMTAMENDTDYTIRMSFLAGESLHRDGFELPRKAFNIHTPCAGNCSGTTSLSDFIDLFVTEINNDPDDIITASKETGDILRLTIGSSAKKGTVAGINPYYNYLRQYQASVSFPNGFERGGYTVSNTPAVYEEGSGYDVQRDEYVAAGWNLGIYRDSELLGLFQNSNFTPQAVAATNYWLMRLNYNVPSNSGGFLSYQNQMETLIAVPDSATYKTLIDALVTMGNTNLVAANAQTQGIVESYS